MSLFSFLIIYFSLFSNGIQKIAKEEGVFCTSKNQVVWFKKEYKCFYEYTPAVLLFHKKNGIGLSITENNKVKNYRLVENKDRFVVQEGVTYNVLLYKCVTNGEIISVWLSENKIKIESKTLIKILY
jgi:hypothetical protein